MEQFVSINENNTPLDTAKAGILHMLAVRHRRVLHDPDCTKNRGISVMKIPHQLKKGELKEAFLHVEVLDTSDVMMQNPYQSADDITRDAVKELEKDGLIKEISGYRMEITSDGLELTPYGNKNLEALLALIPNATNGEAMNYRRTAMKAPRFDGVGRRK